MDIKYTITPRSKIPDEPGPGTPENLEILANELYPAPMGDLKYAICWDAARRIRRQAWQPIETAPKDGTVIDLGGIGDFPRRWRRWCDARWVEYENNWRGPWSDDCESEIPDRHFVATHWMHRPEQPT